MQIYKEFTFEAAHHLPQAPQGHPNARVHGHSFRVRVTLSGRPAPQTGLIVHFGDLEEALGQIKARLDHRYLNDIKGLETPTLEHLALWIWEQLAPLYPGLDQVEISRDTCHEGCIYRGPQRTDRGATDER